VASSIQVGAEQAGKSLARVTVAKPLPSEQKNRLGEALAKRLGRPVIVEEIVDPTVLGSVRVECGADVIDDTVSARLQAVRRDFQ
jgi:F-type H+-transporting ATPase subunit delta